jgi:hypothetical protein
MLERGYKPKRAARLTMRHSRISRATLQNYIARVRGAPERLWLYLLWPRWIARASAEVSPAAWAMFKADYLGPERLSAADCIKRLRQTAIACGWKLPGTRALQRLINRELNPQLTRARR